MARFTQGGKLGTGQLERIADSPIVELAGARLTGLPEVVGGPVEPPGKQPLTVFIDDIYGRIVAYERLLPPFSDGGDVTDVIASLKTISAGGGFEIRNLMRGNDTLPTARLRAVIDCDLFHRAPGRTPVGDVIEFG
jgi:hypothetical protein